MIYTLHLMKGFQTLLLGMFAVELALLTSSLIAVRVPGSADIADYILTFKEDDSFGQNHLIAKTNVLEVPDNDFGAPLRFFYDNDS